MNRLSEIATFQTAAGIIIASIQCVRLLKTCTPVGTLLGFAPKVAAAMHAEYEHPRMWVSTVVRKTQ